MRRWMGIILFLVLAGWGSGSPFDSGRASFAVKFKEEVSPYHVFSAFVLPGEKINFEATRFEPGTQFEFICESGQVLISDSTRWQWLAPVQTGLTSVMLKQSNPPDSIRLNVVILVPVDSLRGEYLNGYRIGKYPEIPLKQLSIYQKPRGFIEVTDENVNLPVSPHFRLGQFLCKQDGDFPKYLILRERLILKLERILQEVNKKGYNCETFEIMSGYRTPYYNKAIGNVKYSRHLWGGAADIFIDEAPRDGEMDDLTGDGVVNYKDAAVLYDIIDKMYGQPWYDLFAGGLGRYRRTKSHGPFVHVDVRGFRARWGD